MEKINLDISSAILCKQKSNLKIMSLRGQKLRSFDVLIKIKYSGVCKSQLMEIEGTHNTKNIFLTCSAMKLVEKLLI